MNLKATKLPLANFADAEVLPEPNLVLFRVIASPKSSNSPLSFLQITRFESVAKRHFSRGKFALGAEGEREAGLTGAEKLGRMAVYQLQSVPACSQTALG